MEVKKIVLFITMVLSSTYFAKAEPFMVHPLDNMPIMEKIPNGWYGSLPIEQRGQEFRRFLSVSLKIKVQNGSGSGSIVYYDEEKNIAYVASCGHLWNRGIMNAEEGKSKKIKCKVVTWYKNDIKLDEPEEFDANLIFYSYTSEIDTALVTFKPNWKPNYFPIAPLEYKYKFNSIAHSCGCDGGKEVAHYEVKLLRLNGDLITTNNSPRPGRSGGGLFDEELYIGTCWGTQYVDGSGIGYFTPIKDIHKFWSLQKDYSFLLDKSFRIEGKILKIVDRNRKQEKYNQDYILAP